mgnify:CR=1 FL=1|jgi:hypothetical protein|tara:strand:- start:784 stop:957 length:174 start_codon:yes stop_codon:yes gene_type:complete
MNFDDLTARAEQARKTLAAERQSATMPLRYLRQQAHHTAPASALNETPSVLVAERST